MSGTHAQVAARRAAVCRLTQQGVPRRKLPALLGASHSQIHRDLKVLYATGRLIKPLNKPPQVTRHDSLKQVLARLTPEEAWWLFNITVKGSSVSDTIASILRDAYASENNG